MPEAPEPSFEELLRERARIDVELRRHQAHVAILFTDVVGSTSYYDRFGNLAGVLLMQRHDDVVLSAIEAHKGRKIKSTGDGAMAEFADSVDAVRAAIAMQQALIRKNEPLETDERIQLRTGINFGEIYRKGDDVSGDAVNVASRVCGECGPAQILISTSVYAALNKEADIQCNLFRRTELRGKKEPEDLYEVTWADHQTYSTLRKDVTQLLDRGLLVTREMRPPPPPDAPPSLGAVFAGRYEIQAELGGGGLGIVYRAMDQDTNEMVAVKVLRPEVAADQSSLERFKNELRVARKITHRNVCRVYEFGRAGALAYISMELVQGPTLKELTEGKSVPPWDEALPIVLSLCEGLAEVHRQGAVHRDLKPSNIMIDTSGEIKLMDFGIAGFGNTGLTMPGRAMGTPRYMSPEQVEGKPVDPRTDVYSLGLIMYELLTGKPAFDGDTPVAVALKRLQEKPASPRQHDPKIHPALERVVMKCLEREPDARYRNAAELHEDLLRTPSSTVSGTAADMGKQGNPKQRHPLDAMTYVYVPAGLLEMGASDNDPEATGRELPRHTVTLTQEFWISETPVTIRAYRRFAKATGRVLPMEFIPSVNEDCPITGVTWEEAEEYCEWAGGRLPTEAEWEYAARGGCTGPRYGEAAKIAWFQVSPPAPQPVKRKEPNAFGLYDTLGNVWEWCSDWFSEYEPDAQTDPQGPARGSHKVLRGGSWDDHPAQSRLSNRAWNLPQARSRHRGFRCVLERFPET